MSKRVKLGEVVSLTEGYKQSMSSEYINSGVPFLRSLNILPYHIDYRDMIYVSQAFSNKLKKSILQKDDVLIVRTGKPGTCCVVPDSLVGANCSDLIIARPHKDKVDPYYLSAFINTLGQKQISNYISGAVQKHLYLHAARNLDLLLPPLAIQERISITAKVLNDLIDTNNRVIDRLEANVQDLYGYWFWQFDFPNTEGKPYKSSGGNMEWNEELRREIPKGWRVSSLVDNPLASLIKPGVETFDKKTYLATGDVVGTEILPGNEVEYESRGSRANMQPRINSVWFAKMKSSVKHLFLTDTAKPIIDSTILSTGFFGLECQPEAFGYIASVIASPQFETVKDHHAHGATQQAVSNADMRNIKIPIPNAATLKHYQQVTTPFFETMNSLLVENRRLIKLRDWLLPLLMTGQAIISDDLDILASQTIPNALDDMEALDTVAPTQVVPNG